MDDNGISSNLALDVRFFFFFSQFLVVVVFWWTDEVNGYLLS